MGNFIKKIPPLTLEQIEEIRANAPKSDAEIDLSDIPEITHEEFVRAIARKRAKQKNLKVAGWKKISAAKVVGIFFITCDIISKNFMEKKF